MTLCTYLTNSIQSLRTYYALSFQLNVYVHYETLLTARPSAMRRHSLLRSAQDLHQRYTQLVHLRTKRLKDSPCKLCIIMKNRFSSLDFRMAYLCLVYCFAESDSTFTHTSRLMQSCTHQLILSEFRYLRMLRLIPGEILS